MNNIKDEILSLVNKLNEWSESYYNKNVSIVDDFEYDQELKRLIELEKKYPEFIFKNSPTQNVGYKIQNDFQKYKHKIPMLSLDNAFGEADLLNFEKQIKKELGDKKFTYYVEPKIDGLSISLIYENGKLKTAITRGDGIIGEIVTSNVKTIKSIPKTIANNDPYFEVRGEVYLSKKMFEQLNNEREKNNEPLFANPRNAASGTLRQLDSKIVESRNLDIWCYFLMDYDNFFKHSETINYLKELNFPVTPISKKCENLSEVLETINKFSNMRNKLDYEIDGVVIKVDEFQYYNILGRTAKFPKWAIAYKFPSEVKITKLLDIFPTIGRTGKITYNAKLEPINLLGTTVKAATLHNANFIIDRDIRIGCNVKVKKAGDIIPEVLESLKENNFYKLKKWEKATNCPSCNEQLVKYEDEVDQYCINISCEQIAIRSLAHYVSRDALNIEGLSIKIIEKLYKNNFLKNIQDLYELKNKKEQLIKLDKMGNKLIENILNSIEQSKNQSVEKLLYGLGIKHVGKKTAYIICRRFKNIEEIGNVTVDDLLMLNDIGTIVAKSIVDWYKIKSNREVINYLKKYNVNLLYKTTDNFNKYISNKNWVITGKLSKSRNYYKSLLLRYNAQILENVNNNIDYLLVGEKPGSKLEKANNLNIKILNEKEFEELVKNG